MKLDIEKLLYIVGTITALWGFYKAIKKAFEETLDSKIAPLRKDVAKIGDITYQMLDHMSTNNNTGNMKKALDEYNNYFRHS